MTYFLLTYLTNFNYSFIIYTIVSLCVLLKASCESEKAGEGKITYAHQGECGSVCGSDGQLYGK